jgi:hypothetical protein
MFLLVLLNCDLLLIIDHPNGFQIVISFSPAALGVVFIFSSWKNKSGAITLKVLLNEIASVAAVK